MKNKRIALIIFLSLFLLFPGSSGAKLSKLGTVTMSMVTGTAFMNDSAQSWTGYTSLVGQPKQFKVRVTDTNGYGATGWIGALGTGETYTDLIGGTDPHLGNGDFADWTNDNPDTWTISENENNYVTENVKRIRIVSNNTGATIANKSILTQNKLYKYSIDVISTSGLLYVTSLGGTPNAIHIPTSVFSSIGTKTGYFVNISNYTNFGIIRASTCDITLDNITVQLVNTPTTNGVWIHPSKTSAATGWESIQSGFNANSIASYETISTSIVPGKTHYVYAKNQTGLVGEWSLSSGSKVGSDYSGRGGDDLFTPVGSPTAADGFDGETNGALTFNGSTQYLTQKVYGTKQGVVTASMVAGTAFINDSGQDFVPYVGVSGASKPYMLVATDSTGLKAWGYIGEQGTGETLGSELITNGNFTAWTGDNPDEWIVPEDVNNYVTQNPAGKCNMISSATNLMGIYKNNILTTNALYYNTLNINTIAYGGIYTAQGETLLAIYYTEGIKNAYFSALGINYYIASASACNVVFDDVSIKQVLTPTTNGVKIYSTKTGTTQSWANVETGFNANSVSSYEIRKTDFQITGAITVGAWVKTSSATLQPIIDKYPKINNPNFNKAYSLHMLDNGKSRLGISTTGISTGEVYILSTSAINDNTWHFITAIYTPSTSMSIYIDGVLNNTNSTNIPASIYDGLYQATIGYGWDTARYFSGSIDFPFIYSRALSSTEVYNLYRSQWKTKITQIYNLDPLSYFASFPGIKEGDLKEWFKDNLNPDKLCYLKPANNECQQYQIAVNQ